MPFSEYSHRQTNGQKFELIELMLEPDKQMCPSATIVLNSQFKTGRKNLIVFTLFLEISGKMNPRDPNMQFNILQISKHGSSLLKCSHHPGGIFILLDSFGACLP